MSSAVPKAALRRQALERRRAVDPATRAALSARLAEVGLDCARRWRPRVVAAFSPIRDEPDPAALLAALQRAGFATALPVNRRARRAARLPPVAGRRAAGRGAMGVLEPKPAAASVEPDLLFVPLAAFDRQGNRLGYGAGCYDRALKRLRAGGPIRAVGVAYAASEVPAAPAEAHDERLDFILTEREWIVAPGAG